VGAKRGYITAAYDEHELFSTAIVTGAGVDTENLTLRLVPTAVLTGHVFDEFGEPVRAASVILWRDDHSAGISRTVRGWSRRVRRPGSVRIRSTQCRNLLPFRRSQAVVCDTPTVNSSDGHS